MAPPSAIEVLPETDTSTFTVPDRLTIQAIAKRRAASGKLIAGVAAAADIGSFKGRTHHLHKHPANRWDHRLTAEAKSRGGSSLKEAAKFLKQPGLISLGGGLPSSEYFPVEEVTFKVPVLGTDNAQRHAVLTAGKHDMASGTSDFDLATALQYGQGHGSAQLLRWMVEHTELVHNPPYRDWSCTMTVGSTSAFDIALRMLSKPGDFMLSEEYTFPAAVEAAGPVGVRVAAVQMDEGGMLAESLDDVLCSWDEKARGGRKPFLLYTVPTGQNPTGSTQSLQRRKQIYEVAQKHDLYILEDEPYYFLQMQPYTGQNAPDVPAPASHQDFLASLVPSYLSLDTDGRVMRMDSFSKVIAPGTRVGWITASEQICKCYSIHADLSTQSPSGLSQMMLFKILEEHWDHDGYLDWLLHIRMEYTQRRNVILEACEQHLPKEVVSWRAPSAGMFHWLRVEWHKHPDYPHKTLEEIEDELFHANMKHGTLLMKGSWFCPDKTMANEKMFFRATYAAAPLDQIREAVRRFGEALREAFGLPAASNGH
ncbi:Aromatic/aminoadipate aminotransferase 1 [Elasticomyces elasticus]|nr:Aromatic/aminoadipate aminotransferase 1 [Elasticomyces elasticus]KAK3618355.1 Aromatic/aminoadipate aminotransferase 1 [Elasticomyces elasticus]KAK4903018.1 Aromatic/aminoadipate aminotransferase 1 [Elasticomyces elasticus]